MNWLGVVALGALLLISRRLILTRWRQYRIGHRAAAALWASTIPLILVILWAAQGIDSVVDPLFLAGLVLLIFGSTYLMALWFLRAMGGEMDPPSSSGYRRRP